MKNLWIILLSACVGALLSTMLTRSCQQPQIPPQPQIIRDTVIDVQIDTQYFPKPVPYRVEVRDTIRLTDTIYIGGQMLFQEVKEYKDSSYYAKISGINAYLEEIEVYPRTTTQYIHTAEKVYEKPRKWGIGIQVGYGAGKNGIQPYVGVGIQYDLLRF